MEIDDLIVNAHEEVDPETGELSLVLDFKEDQTPEEVDCIKEWIVGLWKNQRS